MNNFALLAVALLLSTSAVAKTHHGHHLTDASKTTSATVTLNALKNYKENGVAQLTALPNGHTRVAINVSHEFVTASQPAHIHMGSCANLNPAPKYPLNNVRRGRSVTDVPVSLSTLLKGHYAINIHKSARKINDYVACGDIKAGNISTTVTKHGSTSNQ